MEHTIAADVIDLTANASFMDKAWSATRQMLSQAATPQTALVAGIAVAATGLAVLAWNRRNTLLDTTSRTIHSARCKMSEAIAPKAKPAASPVYDAEAPDFP